MSDTKSKLDALKAAFEKKTTSSGGDQSWKLKYPFWKMADGATAIVRFLPDLDPDNSLGFLVESLQHELHINGQKKVVPCLSMHGEDCPICALSRKYYDEKNDLMGKKYYRKKSYIGQVIVIESPIEHDQAQLVKLIEFGPALFKQIQAAFQSGDLENTPFELKGGYNFRIKKTKNGEFASYTTSSFAPKQSDLDDDIIAQLELYNLADYRGQKLDFATVEAMLIADQTGAAFKDPTGGDDSDDDTPVTAAPQAAKSVERTAEAETSVTTPAKVEQEQEQAADAASATKSMSALDQLRARALAKVQSK